MVFLPQPEKKVVIEHNHFDHIARHCIFISCDAQEWYESGRTEQVIIRNNTFESWGGAAISYEPTGNNDPDHCLHKNLLVENNVFDLADPEQMRNGSWAALLDLKSVEHVIFRNNTIKNCAPDADESSLYRFDNCKDVTLEK